MHLPKPSPATVVAVAAVFWGLWWLPLRAVGELGVGPSAVNFWIYATGGAVLLPVLWTLRGHLVRGGAPLFAAAALYAVSIVAWNGALQTGEVVRATLLFYLAPVWGTILGRVVLGEAVGARRLAAVVFGVGGAGVLLAGGWPPVPRALGDWLALAAGLTFAGSATAARFGRVNGRALTALSFALAAAIAGAVAVASGGFAVPSQTGLAWLAAASVLWMLPVTWGLLWGAGRLDPGRLSLLMLLEVVAAAASAAALADEPFGLREAAGCALILAAGALEATGAPLRRGG